MTNILTLPYDLSSLTWNEDKTKNEQDVYCYCGKGFKEHKSMIQCGKCDQLFHCDCCPVLKKKPLLYGDIHYDFTCSVCTQNEELYSRVPMKWREVVELVLYHMTKQRRLASAGKPGKQPERFYFHFTSEICKSIETHWNDLMPDREPTNTWANTVASALSTRSDIFLPASPEVNMYRGKGWWALQTETPLKKAALERQEFGKRTKSDKPQKKLNRKRKSITTEGVEEKAKIESEISKRQRKSISDESTVFEKEETLIKQEEKLPDQNVENNQAKDATTQTDTPEKITMKEDTSTDIADNENKSKTSTPKRGVSASLILMSQHDEWKTYQALDHTRRRLSPVAARLKRKLALRRLKRNGNLKLFDIDHYVGQHLRSTKSIMEPITKHNPVLTSPAHHQNVQPQAVSPSTATARSTAIPWPSKSSKPPLSSFAELKSTKYEHSFASRLYGRPRHTQTLTSDTCWLSAWNGRKLRPYIRRDYESKPARMRLLEQIKAANGRPTRRQSIHGKESNDDGEFNNNNIKYASIDYVYFQREHLEQVNQLLARCFWDGIDVSESLQFPEFSVVALYKRCVIGCAFMTPEAYITYFAVLAGWERAGIGQFMLYHLFQTALSKDITLHVSANNNAMILYQKFGFKPEEFIVNFYDKYLPAESSFSKNAFLLRLRR